MKINRIKLIGQLEAVAPGLSKRDGIEQGGHFVFKGGKVMTFNDEVACVGKTDLDLEGAVPHRELLELLRKLDEDEVELKVEKGELRVAGERRKAGIRMDAEVALPLDAVDKPGKWRKLPEGFWEALSTAAQCASGDESKFVLTCVHLTPDHAEASDSFQIARCRVKTGLEDALMKAAAVRAFAGMGLVGMSETEGWLHFRDEAGLVLSTRKLEGRFPKRETIELALRVEGEPVTLPKGIGASLAKAELFCGDACEGSFKVELRPGRMRTTGRGPNGWYSETFEVEYDGEPLQFSIAPKMLLEVGRRAERCVVGKSSIKVATDGFEYVSCIGEVEE